MLSTADEHRELTDRVRSRTGRVEVDFANLTRASRHHGQLRGLVPAVFPGARSSAVESAASGGAEPAPVLRSALRVNAATKFRVADSSRTPAYALAASPPPPQLFPTPDRFAARTPK